MDVVIDIGGASGLDIFVHNTALIYPVALCVAESTSVGAWPGVVVRGGSVCDCGRGGCCGWRAPRLRCRGRWCDRLRPQLWVWWRRICRLVRVGGREVSPVTLRLGNTSHSVWKASGAPHVQAGVSMVLYWKVVELEDEVLQLLILALMSVVLEANCPCFDVQR